MAEKRQIWTNNWGYKEGLAIGLSLFLTGVFLEYFSDGKGIISLIEYPFNIILLGLLLFAICLLWFAAKTLPAVKWLGSIPGAISAISLFLFVGLIMGLTIQSDRNQFGFLHDFGFTHITTSWPYLLSVLFLLLSLGITCLKNIFPMNLKKLGFTVSHIGLFIVLASANFGSSQILRLEMRLQEGRISTHATDNSNNLKYNLPFAIKLEDFILEEYNPKLTIVNNISGEMIHANGMNISIIDDEMKCQIMDYYIEVEDYFNLAAKAGNKYYFNNEPGSSPAALLKVIKKDGSQIQGWISCGSYNRPFESLKIDSLHSLVMLFPEPKLYRSKIQIITQKGEITDANLEVNKPFKYNKFKIYQLSYNSDFGRWSDESLIELIYDPWLPYVYFGIFLMIVGALYILWTGAIKKK